MCKIDEIESRYLKVYRVEVYLFSRYGEKVVTSPQVIRGLGPAIPGTQTFLPSRQPDEEHLSPKELLLSRGHVAEVLKDGGVGYYRVLDARLAGQLLQ